MKKLLAASVLSLALASPAAALTVDYETISGTRYSSPYGWAFSYDIGFIDNALRVDIDLATYGATVSSTLLNRWEQGIESLWSTTDRFKVPILFNVDWVSTGYDYLVHMIDGPGRWNMRTWYTMDAAGWGDAYQEEVAAHEYGHMLSLWDEYVGGAVDPVTHLTGTGGLMHTPYGGTLDYYYDPFLNWYEEKLASYGGEDPAPVPEPSTFALLLGGLSMLAFWRRQRA